MGEQEGHYQPVAHGPVRRLRAKIIHADPDPLNDWFARHNRYSDWEAHLRATGVGKRQVRRYRSRQGRVFDALPGKPLIIFLYNYVWRSGWRDGQPGFEYAVALAFYQWQIALKTREREGFAARSVFADAGSGTPAFEQGHSRKELGSR